MATRQIRVSGRVQGVGYRASLQEKAQALGLTGWVRNRYDGTVEALLQGSAQSVEELIAWARRGPTAARVTEVLVTEAGAEPAHARFEVRPTS
jgi:acylphosphatase